MGTVLMSVLCGHWRYAHFPFQAYQPLAERDAHFKNVSGGLRTEAAASF